LEDRESRIKNSLLIANWYKRRGLSRFGLIRAYSPGDKIRGFEGNGTSEPLFDDPRGWVKLLYVPAMTGAFFCSMLGFFIIVINQNLLDHVVNHSDFVLRTPLQLYVIGAHVID
jgi:hypothetical protein